MDVNQITVIGNVGRDPRINTTRAGGKMANFSVATTRSYTTKAGEKKSITTWFEVSTGQKGLVELIEKHVHKGSRVCVIGEVNIREYEGKDGTTKTAVEIQIGFSGQLALQPRSPAKEDGDRPARKPTAAPDEIDNALDDDIPF